MHNDLFHCRVCGLRLEEPPWGEDGRTPLFDLCPCCGVEFGYQDASLKGVRAYRSRWLEQGAPWDMPKQRPADWNLDEQLAQIPQSYA
jgi:hypothetical protein